MSEFKFNANDTASILVITFSSDTGFGPGPFRLYTSKRPHLYGETWFSGDNDNEKEFTNPVSPVIHTYQYDEFIKSYIGNGGGFISLDWGPRFETDNKTHCSIGHYIIEQGGSCKITVSPTLPGCIDQTGNKDFNLTISDVYVNGYHLTTVSDVIDIKDYFDNEPMTSGTITKTITIKQPGPIDVTTGLGNLVLCSTNAFSYYTARNCAPEELTPPVGPATPVGDFTPCQNLIGTDKTDCDNCHNQEGVYTAIGCIPLQPGQFVAALIRVLLIVGIGVAFLLILYGSFLCLTSRGNPQQTQACRETITAAIVGIILLIFALVIVRVIFGSAGILPGYVNIF